MRPASYLDEVQDYLRDAYGVTFGTTAISRALKRVKWNKKIVSKEINMLIFPQVCYYICLDKR